MLASSRWRRVSKPWITALIFQALKDFSHAPKIDRVLSRQLNSPWALGVPFSALFALPACMQCTRYSVRTFAIGIEIYEYYGCMNGVQDTTGVQSLAHKRVADGGDDGFDEPESPCH